MADKTKAKESVYCDFCGKSRDEVKKMIVGNEVAICNECVDLCSNILNKELEVELEKKAETQIKLEKNGVNQGWITVECKRSRNRGFETFSFTINENGLPEFVDNDIDL